LILESDRSRICCIFRVAAPKRRSERADAERS